MSRKRNDNPVLTKKQANEIWDRITTKGDNKNVETSKLNGDINEDSNIINEYISEIESKKTYRKPLKVIIKNKINKKPVNIDLSITDKRRIAIMTNFEEMNPKLTIDEFLKYNDNGKLINCEKSSIILLSFITWNNGLKEEMERLNIINDGIEYNSFTASSMVKFYIHSYPKSEIDLYDINSYIGTMFNKIENNPRRNFQPIGFIERFQILNDKGFKKFVYKPHLVMTRLNVEQAKQLSSINNDSYISIPEALNIKKPTEQGEVKITETEEITPDMTEFENNKEESNIVSFEEMSPKLTIDEFTNYNDNGKLINGKMHEIISLSFITWHNGLKERMIDLNIINSDIADIGFTSRSMANWYVYLYPESKIKLLNYIHSYIGTVFRKIENNQKRNSEPIGFIERSKFLIENKGRLTLIYRPHPIMTKLNIEQVMKLTLSEDDTYITSSEALNIKNTLEQGEMKITEPTEQLDEEIDKVENNPTDDMDLDVFKEQLENNKKELESESIIAEYKDNKGQPFSINFEDVIPLTIDEFLNYEKDDFLCRNSHTMSSLMILSFITWNNGLKEEMKRLGLINSDSKDFTSSSMIKWYIYLYPRSANIIQDYNFVSYFGTIYTKLEYNAKRNSQPIGFIERTRNEMDDYSDLKYAPNSIMSKLNIEQVRQLMASCNNFIPLSEVLNIKESFINYKLKTLENNKMDNLINNTVAIPTEIDTSYDIVEHGNFKEINSNLTIDEFTKYKKCDGLIDDRKAMSSIFILSFITWNNGLKEEMQRLNIIDSTYEGFTTSSMVEFYIKTYPKSEDKINNYNLTSYFSRMFNKIEKNPNRDLKPIGFIQRDLNIFNRRTVYEYKPSLIMSKLNIEQVRQLTRTNYGYINLSEALSIKEIFNRRQEQSKDNLINNTVAKTLEKETSVELKEEKLVLDIIEDNEKESNISETIKEDDGIDLKLEDWDEINETNEEVEDLEAKVDIINIKKPLEKEIKPVISKSENQPEEELKNDEVVSNVVELKGSSIVKSITFSVEINEGSTLIKFDVGLVSKK